MITFAFYLHLQSLAFDGSIHGFKNSHNFPPLDSAANRALPRPNALQEMAALVLEWLDRFDARADDVAVANLKAKFSIRSEERRVGEESRSRWSPDHLKKKKKNSRI